MTDEMPVDTDRVDDPHTDDTDGPSSMIYRFPQLQELFDDAVRRLEANQRRAAMHAVQDSSTDDAA